MLLPPAVHAAATEAPAAITLPALKANVLPACDMEALCWGYWDSTQTQASPTSPYLTPRSGWQATLDNVVVTSDLQAGRAPAIAECMAWHWPCHEPEASPSGLAIQKRHSVSDQMHEAKCLIQAAWPVTGPLLLPLQGPFSLQDLARGLSAGQVSRDLQLYHLAASTEVLYLLHQLLGHAEQQPEQRGAAAPGERPALQVSPPQQPQPINGHVRNGLTSEREHQAEGLPGKAVAAAKLAQQGLHGPAQPASSHTLVQSNGLEPLSSRQNGSAEATEPCGSCPAAQLPLNGLRAAPGKLQASRPPGLGHVLAKPAPGPQQHQQPQGAPVGHPAAFRASRPPGLGHVAAKPAPESQHPQQPQGAQTGQPAASRGQQAAPGVMDVKAALATAR